MQREVFVHRVCAEHDRQVSKPVRAEHAFPPTTGSLYASCLVASSLFASSFRLRPSRGSGQRLASLGPAAAFGGGGLRFAQKTKPRFARRDFASLGLAELRRCLSNPRLLHSCFCRQSWLSNHYMRNALEIFTFKLLCSSESSLGPI